MSLLDTAIAYWSGKPVDPLAEEQAREVMEHFGLLEQEHAHHSEAA